MSVAAGIDCASLSRWLGEEHALVRCMPNTPSLVQAGASGLYANGLASEAQHATAERIMSAVGRVYWLEDESLLDAVTAVSGSEIGRASCRERCWRAGRDGTRRKK